MGVPEVMKISSFMDSLKCPELAKCFSDKDPTTVNEMMKRLDDCPLRNYNHVTGEQHRKSYFPSTRRDDRPLLNNNHVTDQRRYDPRSNYRGRDNIVLYRGRDNRPPYPPPRGDYQARVTPVLTLDALTKPSKEILATETQLCLAPPRPMIHPQRDGNMNRFCDYHQEKGHYTNDCHKLKRQLEAALELGKLNHLIKDVRQRGRGNLGGMVPNKPRASKPYNRNIWEWTGLRGFEGPSFHHPFNVKFLYERYHFASSSNQALVIISECRRLEKKKVVKEEKKEEVGTKMVNVTVEVLVNLAFLDQLVVIGEDCPSRTKTQVEILLKGQRDIFFCGKLRMPFELKNAGATYQRLIDSTFQSHIRRNLEAYVDDMVIKSKDEKMLLEDVAETFNNMRRINMKLNPKKCSFGMEEGKFLGYMVTSEGIHAKPKKTRILADLQSPRTLKEM
ncbi:reverse transcriptase domain-containing protein [Tanacetum coccineum]